MSRQRVLLPATAAAEASNTVDVTPASAGGPIARRQGRGKEKRHRHTTREWDDVKKSIEEVYFRENASLDDVKEELKRDCGFEASIRQYKVKVKEWGLAKYIKALDMQILLAKREKRTRNRGVGTIFVRQGVKLEEDRLNRFGKRELAKSSDYISPSNTTPAGVSYYTPKSIIDTESPHVDTDDVFILQNAHHYRNMGAITTVQAMCEPVQTSAGEGVASWAHTHRAAEQGIACRGRFSDNEKAMRLLWQARNLAIELTKIMLEPGAAPQFWASPQAPEGPGRARIQRLIECVKRAMLCKRLIGVGKQDSSRWLGDWRLMNETEIFNVETAGRLTFGNPSLPYPEMEICTLWVKFDRSSAKTSNNLLRICVCIDPNQERRDCNCCHSICLVLDYMDPDGAVKLNVPLFNSGQQNSEWAHFEEKSRTQGRTINSTWRDVSYIYQGMTPISTDCKKHKRTKTNKEVHFDHNSEEEDSEQEIWGTEVRSDLTLFEPFPPPGPSWICPDSNTLFAVDEEWDSEEDPLASDEEKFEPMAAD